jgi:hypothetical protein
VTVPALGPSQRPDGSEGSARQFRAFRARLLYSAGVRRSVNEFMAENVRPSWSPDLTRLRLRN